ncbi:MAG TPA: thioredoxin [Acidimicrobiales bacterium]|nr:thioredoxin [Acidimicrobiales bacterium]
MKCATCGRANRVPVSAKGHPVCGSCRAELPWLVAAGDADFDAAVDTNVPVLVDLWAAWCGPCRAIAPAVEDAARRFAGRLKVVKVDVDAAPGVARRFRVQGVPTLLILQRGDVVANQVGALPAAALGTWIESTLARTTAATS